MKAVINRLLLKYTHNVLVKHNANILLTGTILTAFFGIGYAVLSYFIDFREGYLVMFTQAGIFFLFPLLFIMGWSLNVIGNLYILVGLLSEAIVVWFTGGLFSPVIPWFGSVPMAALLLVNKKSAWTWCFITVAFVVAYGILALEGVSLPVTYNQEYTNAFFIFCYAGLALIIFVIAVIFDEQKSMAQKASDSLLENILPKITAEELKAFGSSEARLYEKVTVLFADIVDFTRHTENLRPRELVAELDYCFKKFDEIVTRNNVEKIKVIGDAYLCAGGLPMKNNTHYLDVIRTGLEIQIFMNEYRMKKIAEGKDFFDIRIGIHSGPVVAGIVGSKKFSYDIWGDTVNIAARMESSSKPGKINISESTYQEIKSEYCCEYRGEIEAKNKGKLKMYFIAIEPEAKDVLAIQQPEMLQ